MGINNNTAPITGQQDQNTISLPYEIIRYGRGFQGKSIP